MTATLTNNRTPNPTGHRWTLRLENGETMTTATKQQAKALARYLELQLDAPR